MHSEVRSYVRVETEQGDQIIDTTTYDDVDFERLMLIRMFNDLMKRLEVPRPRISQIYRYWCPT